MDSAKKKFHHSKKDDEEPKKATAQEEKGLDDENKTAKIEEDEEETTDEEESMTRSPAPITEEVNDEEESVSDPKINFAYNPATQDPGPLPAGATLDDLANENQEVYDQTSQSAPADSGPKPGNPYSQRGAEFGIKNIKQPHMQPNFPANQSMNPNRPPSQFAPAPNQGNFNFRRESAPRSGASSKIYFVVLLVIGLIVLGGAVYLLKNQLKPVAPKPTPGPEVVITTPEPTPTPQSLDRSQFTLRVLNGSGKTGLAAEVSDKLKALGYKIERTGNATNSAFLQTLVRTKNTQDLADQLIKDLSDQSYSAASGSALKSSDASDAEVILGAK